MVSTFTFRKFCFIDPVAFLIIFYPQILQVWQVKKKSIGIIALVLWLTWDLNVSYPNDWKSWVIWSANTEEKNIIRPK